MTEEQAAARIDEIFAAAQRAAIAEMGTTSHGASIICASAFLSCYIPIMAAVGGDRRKASSALLLMLTKMMEDVCREIEDDQRKFGRSNLQ